MLIEISARHGQISHRTQERIQEKIGKLLRFYNRLTSIEVTIDLGHRDNPEVEVRVTLERHDDFVATYTAPSIVAAVTGAKRKIEEQIRRYKDKKHKIRSSRRGRVPVRDFTPEVN
jgi:putative sigma-54 modulation protein